MATARRVAASVEVTRALHSDLGNSRRCEFVRRLQVMSAFVQTGHRSRHRPMTESDRADLASIEACRGTAIYNRLHFRDCVPKGCMSDQSFGERRHVGTIRPLLRLPQL